MVREQTKYINKKMRKDVKDNKYHVYFLHVNIFIKRNQLTERGKYMVQDLKIRKRVKMGRRTK